MIVRSTKGNLALLVLALAVTQLACHGHPQHATDSPAAPGSASVVLPRGRWRLAPQTLDRVILRVSHIVIGYAGSRGATSRWWHDRKENAKRPERSRQEALALALQVSESLRREPQQFADVAARLSDDIVTAPWGGALGTVPASTLSGTMLDAIARVNTGEASFPFETSSGFHIVKFEPPPPDEAVAAARILVTYAGCSSNLRSGRTFERTRAEALAEARRIAAEARQPGASFAQLVDRYTDSADVVQGGDIGRWDIYQPRMIALVLEAVRRLPVGGITEPVDTPEGFQVLQRTPGDARDLFAMSYLWFGFRDASDREDAQGRLSGAIGVLASAPERFAQLQSEGCCKEPYVWSRGRAPAPQVQRALEKLAIGQLSLEPVEVAGAFYLMKRVAAPLEEKAPEGVVFQLPAPAEPNLSELLPRVPLPVLSAMLQKVIGASGEVPLSGDARQHVDDSFRWLSSELPRVPPDGRAKLVDDFWSRVKLSDEDLKRLRTFVVSNIARQMMES
jgi:hypothetical protein